MVALRTPLYLGENPEAQIEYGISPENKERLRGSALARCLPFGPGKLAKVAALSVSDVSAILAGHRNSRVEIWLKLLRVAQILEDKQHQLIKTLRSHWRLLGRRTINRVSGS